MREADLIPYSALKKVASKEGKRCITIIRESWYPTFTPVALLQPTSYAETQASPSLSHPQNMQLRCWHQARLADRRQVVPSRVPNEREIPLATERVDELLHCSSKPFCSAPQVVHICNPLMRMPALSDKGSRCCLNSCGLVMVAQLDGMFQPTGIGMGWLFCCKGSMDEP